MLSRFIFIPSRSLKYKTQGWFSFHLSLRMMKVDLNNEHVLTRESFFPNNVFPIQGQSLRKHNTSHLMTQYCIKKSYSFRVQTCSYFFYVKRSMSTWLLLWLQFLFSKRTVSKSKIVMGAVLPTPHYTTTPPFPIPWLCCKTESKTGVSTSTTGA